MLRRYPDRLYHRVPVILAGLILLGAGQVDVKWLEQWNVALERKPATLTSTARIASADEPGDPLRIDGQVLDASQSPVPGVTVHAYHRDRDGFDFGPGDKDDCTWRLQGWAETDAAGQFAFDTVRPAADHLGREAAHIHFTLISEAYVRQWAPKIFLAGDPRVSERQRERSVAAGRFANVIAIEQVGGRDVLRVLLPLKDHADF